MIESCVHQTRDERLRFMHVRNWAFEQHRSKIDDRWFWERESAKKIMKKSSLSFDCWEKTRKYRSAYDSKMYKNRTLTLSIILKLHFQLQSNFFFCFFLITSMFVFHNNYSWLKLYSILSIVDWNKFFSQENVQNVHRS